MKLGWGLPLLAVAWWASPVRALDATSASPDASAVSAPVTDPALVAAHYRQVLARPEFREAVEPDVNEEMRDWLSQWLHRLGEKWGDFKYMQEMPRLGSLLMSILVVLCLIGLLYTMVRLTRRRRAWDEPEPGGTPARQALRPPEFYEEELRQAVAREDWHAAWLASWRQFLSRLEREHLVEADRSRTNREYLAQLRARSLSASALALLLGMVESYDRFIYGKRKIAEPDWKYFQQQVNEAGLLLHLSDSAPVTPRVSHPA